MMTEEAKFHSASGYASGFIGRTGRGTDAQGVQGIHAARDLITVAAGLVMAFATFYLLEAVVSGLIAPAIAIFVGDPTFETNAFTISGIDFRYGFVLEAAITFVLAAAVVYFLVVVLRRGQDQRGVEAKTRACPECTSSISVVAKRCPRCTAVVQSDPA